MLPLPLGRKMLTVARQIHTPGWNRHASKHSSSGFPRPEAGFYLHESETHAQLDFEVDALWGSIFRALFFPGIDLFCAQFRLGKDDCDCERG